MIIQCILFMEQEPEEQETGFRWIRRNTGMFRPKKAPNDR